MAIDRRGFVTAGTAVTALAAASAGRSAKPGARLPRVIATEESFATPEYIKAMAEIARSDWKSADLITWRRIADRPPAGKSDAYSRLRDRFVDLPDVRLKEMDESGTDMQVLSLASPGVQLFRADVARDLARTSNDFMADAIAKHPTRFAGLAAFAPQDPAGAAKEMERAVNGLKLNGFLVNSYTDDEYLDLEKYHPILEAAEALGKPLYVHPRNASAKLNPALSDYYMYGGQWGFGADTAVHAVRLILSGVFDRYPKLQIILGHMGEGLPYWLYRLDLSFKVGSERGASRKLQLLPSQYFARNFHITSSLILDPDVLRFCLDKLGPERIMFAIDHPYGDPVASVRFFQQEAKLTSAERAQILHRNAERLFGIAPVA